MKQSPTPQAQSLLPGTTLCAFAHLHPRVTTVYEFDGKRYYVAQLEKHILYRVQEADGTLGRLLCVPSEALVPVQLAAGTRKLSSENLEGYGRPPFIYPEDVFRAQVRGGQSGRFVMYASPLARDGAAALLFRPDGTGVFCDGYSQGYERDEHSPQIYQVSRRKADAVGWLEAWQTLEFTWNGARHGLSSPADVLTREDEALLPLCEEVFVEQVWPHMQEPFVRREQYVDEALHFVSGSHEELERITRAICHLDAEAFAGVWERHSLEVRYYAATTQHKGGFGQDKPDYASAWHVDGGAFWFGIGSERLIHLAFAHNTFRGAQWQRVPGRSGRADLQLISEKLIVQVAPPSAHERAEALLLLDEWLNGKVSEQEGRGLLSGSW